MSAEGLGDRKESWNMNAEKGFPMRFEAASDREIEIEIAVQPLHEEDDHVIGAQLSSLPQQLDLAAEGVRLGG